MCWIDLFVLPRSGIVKDEQLLRQVGERLSSARKSRGMTQQQLDEVLGITQQTPAHYEGGRSRAGVHVSNTGRTVDALVRRFIRDADRTAGWRAQLDVPLTTADRCNRAAAQDQRALSLTNVGHRARTGTEVGGASMQ
ncbi:helix-turn-helix transcriptional regulator [Paraburkholderia sp. JHI2823]|uniref:helix-turn-helix domain-containing protein n=1 Tax=Paraburkholderia sp. JHI2823 TaxID=3112960 RepID=UPI00317C5057